MTTLLQQSGSRLVRYALLSASLLAMGHTFGTAVCLTFLSGFGGNA